MKFEEWCEQWNRYLDGPPEDVDLYTAEPALSQLWKDKEVELRAAYERLKMAEEVVDMAIAGRDFLYIENRAIQYRLRFDMKGN